MWADRLWRLTTAFEGPLLGFSYLEPKRHVPHLTDLDGAEARTLGAALARTTRALRRAARAEVVYVYVFGDGIPHLHLHLAPHRKGDPLSDRMIRGTLVETPLPSGATRLESRDYPLLPNVVHARFRARLTRSFAPARRRRGTSGRPRGATGRPTRAR